VQVRLSIGSTLWVKDLRLLSGRPQRAEHSATASGVGFAGERVGARAFSEALRRCHWGMGAGVVSCSRAPSTVDIEISRGKDMAFG